MSDSRYAEQANYWQTTVHPAKSRGEIEQMLDEFGATQQMFVKGQVEGRQAWLIRFIWNGQNYRFLFAPLECKWPEKQSSFGGKRRLHDEQALYQMGRIAVHFVKAILTAAEAQPHALFGFLELPGGNVSMTVAEVGIEGLYQQNLLALPE